MQDAVVVCEKVEGLDYRMVVFLIANNQTKIGSAELKSFLKTRLPDYMVPEHYLWLSAFPIKENGKIDKEKLMTFI
ncbi:hypothetical protein PGH43_05105 [Legionella pneumophila 130b]|nr:hypothetical protein PGH43_05105 [Legionella pneumophila 130b]